MKNKKNLLLIVEALICIVLCVFGSDSFSLTRGLLSFPFKQIALGLRELSLLSGVGNIIAWALFTLICAIPVIIAIIKCVKKSFALEDIMLIVLSVVLAPALYYMINSGYIVNDMVINPESEHLMWILGPIIYAPIIGYVIIKIVRCFVKAEKQDLKRYLNYMLYVVNIMLIIGVFGISLEELIDKLGSLDEIDYMVGGNVTYTKMLVIMKYANDVILNLMLIGIVILVQGLVDKININNITDEIVSRAKLVSKCCVWTLIIYVILNVCYNILQFVFIKELYTINGVINIPITIVLAMLVIMLIFQFILEAKSIKDENDMFI